MQRSPAKQSSNKAELSDIALKTLRMSESRYRRLFETARDGILLLNADTAQIEDVNPYLIEMLDYSHAEFLGRKLWEVGSFADVSQSKEMFERLQTTGYVRYNDIPLKTKAGIEIPVEFISNTYDCEGIKVIQCNIRNISERKLADNILHASTENLRAILDNSPYMTWLKDPDGRYIKVNKVYVNYLSLRDQEQIIGKTDFDLFSKELAEKYRADDAEVMAEHLQQRCLEEHLFDGISLHWIETVKTAIVDANNQVMGTTGFRRDITERKNAELQLRNLSAHLQTVREEEKARIAREIHDELGGTMTALKIIIHQLKTDLSENHDVLTLLDQVETMSQLINSAAGITRSIISDLRPTILDDLGLLAAIEWQAGQFHKLTGIKCRVNCIGDKGNLDKLHSIALFRILQEALTNVTRHSGASQVEIEFHHSDEEVMLSVCDNGRGLLQARATQAGAYGMLGMKERVGQLGGTITFDTPPGGGLCMMVTFLLTVEELSIL